jgi:hypothetical protein
MADPNNYIIGQANPTPFASLQQGYALGQGIRQDQQAQQQQQVQLAQSQQQQALLSSLANNPNATAADYAHVMTAIPSMAEPLTKAWTTKNTSQQQTQASNLLQWGAAITNGQPQVAADQMIAQADAMDASNGGQPTQDSQALRTHAQIAIAHPEFALGQIQAMLGANPNGKQAADTLASLQTSAQASKKFPADLRTANADASSAETKASIAKATAPAEIAAAPLKNQQTQQEIDASKLKGQIDTLNTQIAQANSETTRGQLVLERDKLVQQQKQTQFEQGQTVQGSMDAATTALAQVDRVLNHPGLSGVFGIEGHGQVGGVGTITGKLASLIPGTDAADFKATLDTLKSQLFLNNVKSLSGMGALSDAEGKKIADATASLSTDQSASSFRTAVGVIKSTLQRAQAKAAANPQASTTNAGFVLNSPKYGAVTEGMVTKLMKDHPGATRASIIEFLQQPTGQADLARGIPPSPDRTPPNPYPPQ